MQPLHSINDNKKTWQYCRPLHITTEHCRSDCPLSRRQQNHHHHSLPMRSWHSLSCAGMMPQRYIHVLDVPNSFALVAGCGRSSGLSLALFSCKQMGVCMLRCSACDPARRQTPQPSRLGLECSVSMGAWSNRSTSSMRILQAGFLAIRSRCKCCGHIATIIRLMLPRAPRLTRVCT